jgi:hypothetical protein
VLDGAGHLNVHSFDLGAKGLLHFPEVLPVGFGGGPRLLDAPRKALDHRGFR